VQHFRKAIPQDLCESFAKVKQVWADELWRQVAKATSNTGDLAMKLKYLGNTEDEAELHLVIHCEQAVGEIVRWFFKQRQIADKLRSRFLVHVVETAPTRLNSAADVYKDSQRRSTMCGTSIAIDKDSVHSTATLGGLIMVSKSSGARVYGVTAGHAVAGADGGVESASAYDHFQHQDKRKFGAIKYTSSQHCSASKGQNRDWALVSTRAEDWLPNSFRSDDFNHNSVIDCFYNSQVATFVSAPRAVVVTPRGTQRGSLSANRSGILLRPGTSFVEAMDFVPDGGYGKHCPLLTRTDGATRY
jgi:hypothetical protein